MAKSEYVQINAETAEQACEAYREAHGRYPELIVNGGNVELYGGNKGERAKAREFLTSTVIAKPVATEAVETPASTKQINYLRSLAQRDPATAIGLNITTETLVSLAKSEASDLINKMKTL